MTSQNELLKGALREALKECIEHNNEYHHHTDKEKITRWEKILAEPSTPTERVQTKLDCQEWLEKNVDNHMVSVLIDSLVTFVEQAKELGRMEERSQMPCKHAKANLVIPYEEEPFCLACSQLAAARLDQVKTDCARLRSWREGTGASAFGVLDNPNIDPLAKTLAKEYVAGCVANVEKMKHEIWEDHVETDDEVIECVERALFKYFVNTPPTIRLTPEQQRVCICAQGVTKCPAHGNQPAKRGLCPLCGSVICYCPQGQYCSKEDCRYVS